MKTNLVVFAGTLLLACASPALSSPLRLDEESPWPRVRSTNGNTVTLHLPQVERWTSNWFSARAAVEVKPAGAKEEQVGVVWFEAKGIVDHSNRLVTLEKLEITKARFPEASDKGSNALAIVREVLPSGARIVSLDYLIAALGFVQAAARQGPAGLKHTPPQIFWVTNRTVLVLVDGKPFRRTVPGTSLERVLNTPAVLVYDKKNEKYFLAGDGEWFSCATLEGPWSLTQTPPEEVAALSAGSGSTAQSDSDEPPPRIMVSTTPAELLTTSGLPDYRPIKGTALEYAADSDSQLFFHRTERQAYLLLSGRWFKASSLNGPWTHVAPRDLPKDFARIPPNIPQAMVLASVPNTREAELAVVANSVPTTATVNRRTAKIELSYDGDPQFKPIDGTSLRYAVNAQLPVILAGANYYALDNGIWFVAASPTGPWQVASEVPEEIYTIPPSSPVYYATFVRVYNASDEEVEVGYTAGYQGAYEEDGTVVYGTGWDYQPWEGEQYYGWGWTWGYSYVYVPWYAWWIWRPWWNPPGGLRAAVIENIYDRWQSRNGVTHFDRAPAAATARATRPSYSGSPVLYGRHWPSAPSAPSADSAASAASAASAGSAGSAGSAASAKRALSAGSAASAPRAPSEGFGPEHLPGNAVAINPYLRPEAPIRAGEVPRGAQMLSTVRQAPGGGRDLYASPDGNIYQRRSDGWYRRQSGGGWNFYAPFQGTMHNSQLASRGGQNAGAAAVYRPAPVSNRGGVQRTPAVNRIPNAGGEARAQQVAALERQYYARALSQMRAQNYRASMRPAAVARPARGRR